ncbi:hypothetical protein AQS70_22780 [Pseudomonas endophytica]|uniref:Uncharacterized protein n=1 Tax=Pseudomonas endophytica TaxID=1563157 RepID=A0A0Q0T3H7_9PSED|nr:hypothetical protein AQS70_22780 [Pseudomonas endophytica]
MVAAALGLGQYFGDQVVAGVVLVILAQQGQFFAGGVVVVQGLLCEAAVALPIIVSKILIFIGWPRIELKTQ